MSPPSLLRFRDIHGYWRAFRMTGSGPPLLLIHGIGDDSGTWEKVIPRLAEHHTVIAPDLLGHGASAKPRADYAIAAYACGMRDLLSVLEIDRVSVVGHSLGGGIAMQFAYQFPERCERLVLVAPGGIGREVHALLRAAAAPGAEIGLSLAASVPARTAVRLAAPALRLTGGLFLGTDFDYILRRYQGLRTKKARRAFLRSLRAGVDVRGQIITMLDRCYLAEGMPILIIWGREDHVIPVGHAEMAHTAMPGSRLEIFGRCGHFPHLDDPDRFVTTVERFLDTTEPASHDPARWRRLLRAGRDRARARTEGLSPQASSGA